MGYALVVVMVGLWLLGMVTSHLFGGFLHLLLGAAIAIVLRLIDSRPPVEERW